ncbi:hypothetical protein ACMYYO_01755 [Dermacoccaceae bacterium W4C1]
MSTEAELIRRQARAVAMAAQACRALARRLEIGQEISWSSDAAQTYRESLRRDAAAVRRCARSLDDLHRVLLAQATAAAKTTSGSP